MSNTTRTNFCGSLIAHPEAKEIGRFSANLDNQTERFRAAIASIRDNRKSTDEGFVPLPISITLMMSDGTVINSKTFSEGVVWNPQTGDIRLTLSKWDGPYFMWCTVDIHGHMITVTVKRNPHETGEEWRTPNPTISPPPPRIETSSTINEAETRS